MAKQIFVQVPQLYLFPVEIYICIKTRWWSVIKPIRNTKILEIPISYAKYQRSGPKTHYGPPNHTSALAGTDDTPVPEICPNYGFHIGRHAVELQGLLYPPLAPEQAVEGVRDVQWHRQRHASPSFGLLNEGAEPNDSIDRKPRHPETVLALLQSEYNPPGDRCSSRRAAITLSSNLPVSSRRHTSPKGRGWIRGSPRLRKKVQPTQSLPTQTGWDPVGTRSFTRSDPPYGLRQLLFWYPQFRAPVFRNARRT